MPTRQLSVHSDGVPKVLNPWVRSIFQFLIAWLDLNPGSGSINTLQRFLVPPCCRTRLPRWNHNHPLLCGISLIQEILTKHQNTKCTRPSPCHPLCSRLSELLMWDFSSKQQKKGGLCAGVQGGCEREHHIWPRHLPRHSLWTPQNLSSSRSHCQFYRWGNQEL